MVVHKLQHSSLWLLAITIILMTDILIVQTTSIAMEDPMLVYAVLIDFMLVIPFLYWFCYLRKKGKSITKIIPFPLLGALVVWLVLPAAARSTVWNAIWPVELLLLIAELAIIGYEFRIVFRLFKGFRKASKQEDNIGEAMRIAVHKEIGKGKIASLMLHDASLVYYLLLSWRRNRKSKHIDSPSFTYHKKSNQVLYSAIITKIILIEGIVVHLLVQQWSHIAAWILTLADLWLLVLIWGDCRASVLQPVKVKNGVVRLRYGLRIQADIPLELIADVDSAREFHPDQQAQKAAALPHLAIPNIRIDLKQQVEVDGLLFLPRKVTTIFLTLDEPEAFVCELRERSLESQV